MGFDSVASVKSAVFVNPLEDAMLLRASDLTGSKGGSSSAGAGDGSEDGFYGDDAEAVVAKLGGEYAARMLIPSHSVGTIIGRGGCCINLIRETTGARISVLKADRAPRAGRGNSPEYTVVRIEGTIERVSHAQQIITHVICELEREQNEILRGGRSDESFSDDGSYSGDERHGSRRHPAEGLSTDEHGNPQAYLRFLVPEECCGLIIGRGGASIRETGESTGTSMRVIKMDPATLYASRDMSGPEVIVSAIGPQDALLRVLVVILYKTAEALRSGVGLSRPRHRGGDRSRRSGWGHDDRDSDRRGGYHRSSGGGGSAAGGGDDDYDYDRGSSAYGRDRGPSSALDFGAIITETFTLPPDKVGDVIGKGGRRIQEFNRLSGATIHISQEMAPGTDEREVRIRGTAAAIERARDLIAEHFARTMMREMDPLPDVGGDDSGEPVRTVTIQVPTSTIGGVIGKRGVNIQYIQSTAATRIHVITEAETGVKRDPLGSVDIELTGTEHGIAVATQMIYDSAERTRAMQAQQQQQLSNAAPAPAPVDTAANELDDPAESPSVQQ